MNPLIQKYPFDPNKTNQGNYIANEPFNLMDQYGKKNRCVTFSGGYFFTDTVSIMDGNGYTLIPDIDYQATHLNAEAVKLTGLSVCGMLVITNPNISDVVYLSGHLLGGKFTALSPVIKECLDTLQGLTTAAPTWNDIVNKPDDFLPSGHFMLWCQMYGFTPFTLAIQELREQIIQQSISKVDHELSVQTDKKTDLLRVIELLKQRLEFHTRPQVNSHKTSATDIDLNLIDNYPIITTEEIERLHLTVPVRYVDSLKHNEIIEYWLSKKLDHQHEIPFSTLDTYSSEELNTLLSNKLNKNESAYSSERLAENTQQEIRDSLPIDYSANEFKSGLFNTSTLASNTPTVGSVLTNDAEFRTFTELMDLNFPDNQNLLVLGRYDNLNEALSELNTVYVDVNKKYAMFILTKYFESDTDLEELGFHVMVEKINGNWELKGA